MKEIIYRAYELYTENNPLVIATIISKSGSTPRGEGSSMIITENGYDFGTVGGGAQEFQAIELGKNLVREKKSDDHKYILTNNEAEDIGMVCGGTNRIHFEYIDPCDELAGEYLKFIIDNYSTADVSIVYDLDLSCGFTIEVDGELKPFTKGGSSENLFKFKIEAEPKMFILGGGHVSQATVPILNYLGYETIVVENREEFLKEEDFPNSKRYLIEYEDVKKLDITRDDYVIILTRGHISDKIALKSALDKKPKYIGVIGSRKKSILMFKDLEGTEYEEIAKGRVFSPVGIEIGAETPKEIAISITAQIVAVARGMYEDNKD
ncbi:MAG: XdhC family protein [Peptoniphilus sp.]|uniref:XdhC family protein n=1 Tax=Peptoniphilus sp. TaxID=1971214 RepID=UPI002A76160C|nr:XdhC family protein [Peptoniphilus sp.]MDY2987281.1 XdhC family protein [Peptoniphilus sp.]